MPDDPAEWQAAGTWFDFCGLRLFTQVSGSGPTVLVLHGFPTSSYDFVRVLPQLAQHYRLLLFDYPGFGFSDKPQHFPYSLFTYADAAQALLAKHNIKHIYILAHDIGDSVALELLRRGQITVEKLILMNGSVLSIPFEDRLLRLQQKLLLHPISGPLMIHSGLFRKATFARTFNRIFGAPLPAAEITAFWSIICHNKGHRRYHLLLRYMLERWQYQQIWLDTLQAHAAPLTLIWGQADPIATPAVAEEVLRRRPDTTHVPLDGIGHYPHWEAPARVVEAILSAFG